MSPGQDLVVSVAEMNALLAERGSRDHRMVRALGVSYAAHAVGIIGAVIVLRNVPYRQYTASSAGSPGPMVSAYAVSGVPARATSGTRAITRPIPPPVSVKPQPVPPITRAIAPPADDDVDIVEKPQRRPAVTPRPTVASSASRPARETPAPLAPSAPSAPSASPAPGNDPVVDSSHSRDGSVSGSIGSSGPLGGGGGGGLGGMRHNKWYIQRVQDLVLANWGNPFPGQSRPAAALEVVVFFRIRRDGRIVDPQIELSSGNAAWDRSGLRAVETTIQLPPLPADYPGPDVSVHYKFESEMLR